MKPTTAAAATTTVVVGTSIVIDEDAETCDRRRNIALEYSKMEEKQTNLCNLLAKNIYKKFDDENKKEKLLEQEDVNKIFHSIIELEKVAQLVHGQVAVEIKGRVQIWSEKPYFGDILKKYFQFYKVYKSILLRYPQSREALCEALKKPKFANYLQKLLYSEAANLENVTRLDILLDQIVNLPRRYLQLFENYLKSLDKKSQEYDDIDRIREEFKGIQGASDTSIDKLTNFQDCYKLQLMIEPPYELISDSNSNNRQLIKHGDLKKISKKSGEHLMRHLILLNDILLICGFDLLKKKYLLKFEIKVPTIKIIENSDPKNDLIFRIISPEQNNEFLAEDTKDKDSWIKAFKKIEVQFDSFLNTNEIDNFYLIGEVPPTWVKDDVQNHCLICRVVFTTFVRRHHCRTCGKIFCKQCCKYYITVKFDNYRDKHRVCKICDNLLSNQMPVSSLLSPTSAATNTSQSSLSSTATNETTATNTLTSPSLQQNHSNSASDTSNQSINDGVGEGAGGDEKKSKLQNELKNLINNKKTNSKLINRLSCNDTSSTTTTGTTDTDHQDDDDDDDDVIDDDDDDEDEPAVVNGKKHEAKNVQALKELILKNDEELPVKPSYYKKNSVTSLQQQQQQQKIEPAKPTVRKRSTPSMPLNSPSAVPLELFTDSVLVSKINQTKFEVDSNDEENTNNNNKSAHKMWERKWILLTDDRILTVYSNQNDLKTHQTANSIINLNNFELTNVNETTFELKRKEIDPQASTRIKTKSFISLFEYTNYEFKFSNQDNKNKIINLINDLIK